MSVIASYKFDSTVCADFTPEFNSEFTSDLYTITDVDNGDGTTTRTIESDSLPTLMRFGTTGSAITGRERSLLQMLECNTDNITSMNSMFKNCTNLTFINLSNFNTQNVTNMNGMFYNCSKLTSLDVSNFNTSQVTTIGSMFYYCSKLTSLDVSNFNTSQVTNMNGMFYNCSQLTSLDVSNFNTSQVTNMGRMFSGCSKLTSLDVSNFNTSQVTNMDSMFSGCSKLTSLDVSSFNTSQVTTMGSMFYSCSRLTSLDVSSFNTSQVTNMGRMFSGCNLTSLDLSNFNTEKVTNMGNILTNIPSLTNIGAVYCNSSTINKISNLVTTNTTIWYTDAKLDDLIVKDNITYKEYKSNILTVNEDVTLRSNGDICDELNLLTGQLTQRIGEDGAVLSQEVVKTVDLTVVDQDNQPTELGTFENVTYVSLEAENLIPEVEMEVATRISEELASANPLMDDISTKQEKLNTTIDEQSENVDATMIATTEIYEETL